MNKLNSRSKNRVLVVKKWFWRKVAIVFAFSVLLFVNQGCKSSYQEPSILETKVTSFKLEGLTSARFGVEAVVENPNNFSFKVTGIKGVIYSGKEELGTFSSYDELEIQKMSTQTYAIQVITYVSNLQEALDIISNISNLDYSKFTVDISANVKKAGISIPIKKEGVPLSKFLKKGFSLDKLINY